MLLIYQLFGSIFVLFLRIMFEFVQFGFLNTFDSFSSLSFKALIGKFHLLNRLRKFEFIAVIFVCKVQLKVQVLLFAPKFIQFHHF